jgi:hypothetical protein
VQRKFSAGSPLSWTQFYPVAKNYLARNSTSSLVSLYQNKYTLHRSIAVAAALTFWLSVLAMLIGVATLHYVGLAPRFAPLGVLAISCVALTWGFSASYAFNWTLFGNSIITETYSQLLGAQNAKSP